MDIKTLRNPGDKVWIIDPQAGKPVETTIAAVTVSATATEQKEFYSFKGVPGARMSDQVFDSKKNLIASL